MTLKLDAEQPPSGTATETRVTSFTPETKDTPDSTTRKWVSYLLLMLLAGIVIASFIDLFMINNQNPPFSGPNAAATIAADSSQDSDRLMRLMNLVFGPVVTLFSSVVGFYFGARTARESNQP